VILVHSSCLGIFRSTVSFSIGLMLQFSNEPALPMADGDTSCGPERKPPITRIRILFGFDGAVWSPPEVQQSLNVFPPDPDCTHCDPQ